MEHNTIGAVPFGTMWLDISQEEGMALDSVEEVEFISDQTEAVRGPPSFWRMEFKMLGGEVNRSKSSHVLNST
jgi:hypothetical protein